MFNIASIYPKQAGYHFDFDYYINEHIPMSIALLSEASGFQCFSVERGIDVEEPKIESSYVAMCYYYFDTLENFMFAFTPHAEKILNDIKYFTNIEPTFQINRVVVFK